MTAQLFISYRRSQLAAVKPIVAALEAAGVRCFLDIEAIDPLADFPQRIREGIDRSHALLAYWSADYGESDHCIAEFRRAWQHARRHSSDVGRRVWVLNPEPGVRHIFAGDLNSQNFLAPPPPGEAEAWTTVLQKLLAELVPEGPLADERGAPPSPVIPPTVPIPSNQFTGRNVELMRVHNKLHPTQIGAARAAVAVHTHGMGGVGKTELAAKYSRDFAHAYPGGVFWLNFASYNPGPRADEEESQSAWLQTLDGCLPSDRALFFDAEGKPFAAPQVHRILESRLNTESPYLWVLDNVPVMMPEDTRDRIVAFWRAPTGTGRTLITTRDSRTPTGATSEELRVMNSEDALRLLAGYRRPRDDELDIARTIIAEVDAHTQALTLLGEWLREDVGGYVRALQQLRERGRLQRIEEIAKLLQNELGEKARGILATFDMSISDLDEPAKYVLALASACAPNEPIPPLLLESVFVTWPEAVASGVGAPVRDVFALALRQLIRASLLSRRRGNNVAAGLVEIHPLVQDVSTRLLDHRVDIASRRAAAVLLLRLRDANFQQRNNAADIVSHAKHVSEHQRDEIGVLLGLHASQYELAAGRSAAAHVIGQSALVLARSILGTEHWATLSCMGNLAMALRAQADFESARDLLKSELNIHRRVSGEGHEDTLGCKGCLAIVVFDLGDFATAQSMLEDVLNGLREVLGEDHPQTINTMLNLAMVRNVQDDLAGARETQERIVASYRRTIGEDHAQTMRSKDHLADTMRRQEKFAEAKPLQEEVLAFRRRTLGDTHPDTLATMNSLAGTLHGQGDVTSGRAMQQEVLALRQRVLGEDHPDTLISKGNLGEQYRVEGNLEKARRIHSEVFANMRRVLGEDHPSTLHSALDLYRVLHLIKDLPAKKQMLQQTALGRLPEMSSATLPKEIAEMQDIIAAERKQFGL